MAKPMTGRARRRMEEKRKKRNVPTPKFDDAGNPVVVGPPTTGADVQANLSKGHRRNIPKPSPTKAAPAAPPTPRIPQGQSSQEIAATRQPGVPENLFGRPRKTFEDIPKSGGVTDPSLALGQALKSEKKAGDIQTEIDKIRAMTEGIRGGYAHGGGVRGVGKALRGFRPAKMS